jgi:hypothetical protein
MFYYPKDIKQLLEKAWKKKGITLPDIADLLPPESILEELVEVAYHASLMTEEQRRISFRVAFYSKAEIEKHPKEIYEVRYLEFSNHRIFNLSELLRLAPATDPRKALIGVTNKVSSDNKLVIWGLIDTGLGLWKLIRGEGGKSFSPLDCLIVSSEAPGNITISISGEVLLNLSHGEIYSPPLHSLRYGPLSDFFTKPQNDIHKEVSDKLKPIEHSPGILFSDPKVEYLNYIERLLFSIRDKLHGGTVLVISDKFSLDELIKSNKLTIKYKCKYDLVWSLIVNKSILEAKGSEIYQSMIGTKVDMNPEKYWESKSIELDLKKTIIYLEEVTNFISSLASVDGAVIITERLRLLGFGAEFKVHSETVKTVKFAEDCFCIKFKNQHIESYGTRHRSAFRFCFEFPDTAAFIISQDGDVKAVKRVDDDLIVWPDPNSGLLGTF